MDLVVNLVAIGYDSRVDKFRKIENLANLYAGGTTPRDYVMKIMNDFVPSY